MKPEVWSQLKGIMALELALALERDDWIKRTSRGSTAVYTKSGKIVSIHIHPHKTFNPKQLKELLKDIGWTERDLKRLKLIKNI
jgi:predicted RNA binding protein YcfA (HicA-like mRNA interferase family)